jgi:hypothetical protein
LKPGSNSTTGISGEISRGRTQYETGQLHPAAENLYHSQEIQTHDWITKEAT